MGIRVLESRFTRFLKGYQEDFIKAGKELDKEKIPPLTEELFSVYERTANRLEYEKVYFKRRKFLTVYAMLSIMYGSQSDMKSGFPYSWWETSKMNWCAVCCGSIGAAAIWLMKNDRERLNNLLNRINISIMNYIDGFSDDGACLEGLEYYTYGMNFFVAYADLMYRYSDGTIDLLDNAKLKEIALFQQRCFLAGGVTVSFSDSQQDERYRVGLTMYLAKRYPGVGFPPEPLAAKGGHNAEPHNHNDVGSFLYVCDGESVLVDLGAGEYTRDYFNENRYKNICCRSLGHNVPLIDGKEQYAGEGYKATRFVSDDNGKTEIDIEAAYGLGKNDRITRRFLFEKDCGICTVIDRFILSEPREITENLVTEFKPMIEGCNFVIETQKNSFEIKVRNGKEFEIIDKMYHDHYGIEKRIWLLQWKVSGEYTEIVIKKINGASAKNIL